MIIGRDFVFVLAPKCASTSIRNALKDYGVLTHNQHEPLRRQPPHPIVAAVYRPFEDILRSAWRHSNGGGSFDDWRKKKCGPAWVMAGGKDLRDLKDAELWLRHANVVLRFDRLDEDWREFLRLAGLPSIELLHMNKSKEAVV